MTTRVAVVGAGRFGWEHLRTYADIPEVSIVAVVDADVDRARSTAREFGAAGFSSVEEMFASSPPDAVSVAVPAGRRASTVHDLIAQDVGVLIEKPIAPDMAEAERLRELATGRPVMVGHLVRFAEPYVQVARHLHERCGRVDRILVSRTRAERHFTDFPDESLVRLTMIHDLDVVSWLTPRMAVESVSAQVRRRPDGRIEWCEASVRVADGPEVVVGGEWKGGVDDEIDVLEASGALGRASMRLDTTGSTWTTGDVSHSGASADRTYAQALRHELSHFLEAVRLREPSDRLRMEDAAGAVRLADAVERSIAAGGRSVSLSPSVPRPPVADAPTIEREEGALHADA